MLGHSHAGGVGHARLLAAHCPHSYAEIPMQCDSDMSKKTCCIKRRNEHSKHEDLGDQGHIIALNPIRGALWDTVKRGILLNVDF